MFENPPFIKCPKCNQETFGVLIINSNGYYRRCKNCGYAPHQQIVLPKLDKKVIYLDQFAISNMAKAINPQIQRSKPDEFWEKLHEKIYNMCRKQLIVCPSSEFHELESIFFGKPEILKKVYENISGGISFLDRGTLKQYQICELAEQWVKGNYDYKVIPERKEYLHGNLNAWEEKFYVTFPLNMEQKDEEIKYKKNLHNNLSNYFEKFKNVKNFDFEKVFNEEVESFGKKIMECFYEYISQPFLQFQLPTESALIVSFIGFTFERNGIKKENKFEKVKEFFHTAKMENIPFVKIEALLWAAIARQYAKGGKKQPVSQSISNDVSIISYYLPLCDCMFIDNECREFLRQHPLCDELKYPAKIYSKNCKEDFLVYLDEIEKNASNDILKAVNEVYGVV
jgi:hypothetical protein